MTHPRVRFSLHYLHEQAFNARSDILVTGDHHPVGPKKHADRTIIAVQPLKKSEMQVRTRFSRSGSPYPSL